MQGEECKLLNFLILFYFVQVYLEELLHPDQLEGELNLAPGFLTFQNTCIYKWKYLPTAKRFQVPQPTGLGLRWLPPLRRPASTPRVAPLVRPAPQRGNWILDGDI